MRIRLSLAPVLFLLVSAPSFADPVPVSTAHGKVEKADKDTIIIQPRDESGKFGKSVTLHLTGTSRITTLSTRMMDKKVVFVQKDTDAKDLTAGMLIAVVYSTPTKGQDPVLLTAVVQPEK
jgi:hypothetical protein